MAEKMGLRLAEDLIKRYPSADQYPYKSWSYPQGYLLMGMAHLYKITKNKKYYDYIYDYGNTHVTEDGTVNGFTGCSMDDMMPGAVLVWLYEQTKEERFAKACHQICASFLDYPRTREGGFLHDRIRYPGQMWVDGVFMGQMFYCAYGKAFQKPECYEEAVGQLQLIYRYCHVHDGLLVHAYSEVDYGKENYGKENYGKENYGKDNCSGNNKPPWAGPDGRSTSVWSEGLGWYALILVELLKTIPESMQLRKVPERYLRELLYGLKKYQNPETGLWYQVVDKPDDGRNWCETSGSGMFLYAMANGIRLGVITKEEFEENVRLAAKGLHTKMVPNMETGHYDIISCCNGLCVQNKEEDYYFYPQQINAQEAVCSVLWGLGAVMEWDD